MTLSKSNSCALYQRTRCKAHNLDTMHTHTQRRLTTMINYAEIVMVYKVTALIMFYVCAIGAAAYLLTVLFEGR